jgi:putative transposase
MNSLSSLEAAEKVVYLTIQDFNEKWAGRKLRGFAEAHEALERISPFPHRRLNIQSPVWRKSVPYQFKSISEKPYPIYITQNS